jgi:hypothetical protein
MNTELLFFILTAAFVIAGTTIDSWHDKHVQDMIRLLKASRATGMINYHPIQSNLRWKFWGNFYALFTISVVITAQIALEHWWYAFAWYPIMWLLWWTVHDLTTGWFILGKPLHISSDPISQWFGAAFQQSGWLMLGWRLLWLFLLTTGYLMLSFNIKVGW